MHFKVIPIKLIEILLTKIKTHAKISDQNLRRPLLNMLPQHSPPHISGRGVKIGKVVGGSSAVVGGQIFGKMVGGHQE